MADDNPEELLRRALLDDSSSVAISLKVEDLPVSDAVRLMLILESILNGDVSGCRGRGMASRHSEPEGLLDDVESAHSTNLIRIGWFSQGPAICIPWVAHDSKFRYSLQNHSSGW